MKSEYLKDYWKVWNRDVYCVTFRQWCGEMIHCHIYLKLCPPPRPLIICLTMLLAANICLAQTNLTSISAGTLSNIVSLVPVPVATVISHINAGVADANAPTFQFDPSAIFTVDGICFWPKAAKMLNVPGVVGIVHRNDGRWDYGGGAGVLASLFQVNVTPNFVINLGPMGTYVGGTISSYVMAGAGAFTQWLNPVPVNTWYNNSIFGHTPILSSLDIGDSDIGIWIAATTDKDIGGGLGWRIPVGPAK